jgi:hypothetical protein
MMDRSPKPPEALMRAIAADLRPVKPAPLPLRLALQLAPFALLIASLVWLVIGIRRDVGILGPLLSWGASSAQFALAIVLVWVAAHESTPARRLPAKVVYTVATTAVLVVVAATLSTSSLGPSRGMPRISPWITALACGIGGTIAGGILVLTFSWMFRNSLATRPVAAGALYGAGAGIAINASWRIACPASNLAHTLGAHGTAIVATVFLGALIGRTLGARRLRRGNGRS